MTHVFDIDTAMEPAGDGRYEGRMSQRWWVVAGPNGGYVAAMILRGLTHAVGDESRSPRSLTVHFTERPVEGPVVLHTTVERVGHKMTTISGRLCQGERTLAVALAAFSADRSGFEHHEEQMPAVPGPERCPGSEDHTGILPPMMVQLDTRWARGPQPFRGGPASRAHNGAWIRATPERRADAAFVALLTDALPPASFSVVRPADAVTAVPTVDLTIHFRNHVPEGARPGDFYLAAFSTRTATGGFVEEDGEIWTRDGLLLAQSRQLALVR